MNPGNCVFSVMLCTVPRKRYYFGLLYLRLCDMHQPMLIIFVGNIKVVLLSRPTVCKYLSPSHFVFETTCSMTEKTISGVHVSPGRAYSAETLVRRVGITNHHLIAYCLISKIAVKIYQTRLCYVNF